MRRRTFLAVLSLAGGIAGCTDSNETTTSENSENNESDDDDSKPVPGNSTGNIDDPEECSPYEFCRGSELISIKVLTKTSDELADTKWPPAVDDIQITGDPANGVTIKPECREKEYSAEPGEEIRLTRREHGEGCIIPLFVDGEKVTEIGAGGAIDYQVAISIDGVFYRIVDAI